MSAQQFQPEDVDIDIHGLLNEVWQKKFTIFVITCATAVSLFLTFSSLSPLYKSSSRVLIENRETVFTRADNSRVRSELFDKEAIGSQVEVIGSDTVTLAVIKKLGLSKKGEYSGESENSLASDILSAIGLGKPHNGVPPEVKLLEKFKKNLTIFAVNNSRVIVVEFSSKNPKTAEAVPNEIMAEFLKLQKDASLTATQDATQWLGPEIDSLRDRVRKAEAKVASFRANSDILAGNNSGFLATQQLSEISSELTRLRAERSSALARAASMRKALKRGSSLESIPEVESSVTVQRLRQNKQTLSAQISQLSISLLPNHPRLKALQSQLANVDRQIVTAAKNILTGLEDNVDFTKEKEAELRREMNRLKSESSRVGEAEVGLRALEREATAERELLQAYLKQFREAASRQNNQFVPVNARVISKAGLPLNPYFPKIVPYTIAGSVAVFILTVMGILAWVLLSGRAFIKPEAVPETVTVPIADNDSGAEGSLVYSEENVAQVLNILGQARVVMMTASEHSVSSIGWKFARNLALNGRRVALVDLAAGLEATSKMLGRVDLPGLGNVINGTAELTEVTYNDRGSSVQIIPAGQVLARDDGQGVQHLSQLLDGLSKIFDFVIIDCGGTSADGIYPIARADTVVVVNTIGSDVESSLVLEGELTSRGYQEVVMVNARDSGDVSHAA
ncbi:MAG: exopolysaccharide transport family protein [Rhizobiaceae bacterium]